MARKRIDPLELDRETLDLVIGHPHQVWACSAIAQLIGQLRELRTPRDYYEFQGRLFRLLYRAQHYRSQAVRSLKRLRQGKKVTPPASGSWELELMVMDRVIRQVRSVGDGLAWRCFSYDRRILLALSRNAPPGPMVGKAGLATELEEVETVWRREKAFALLHDLTNVLRIADVTKFTPAGPRLIEVKRDPSRVRQSQLDRIHQAIDVVVSGAPVQTDAGPAELFVSSQPFKTHLSTLRSALARADHEGFASARFGRKWVATCTSLTSPGLGGDLDKLLSRWRDHRAKVFERAELTSSTHHLRHLSVGHPDASPTVAPFSIFPFDPDTCARLTCDFLVYDSVMGWDRLSEAFEAAGFWSSCPLQERSDAPGPMDPILIARRPGREMTILGSALNQLLLEFVDPKTYALAVREQSDRPQGLRGGTLTYSNERATWR